MEATFKKFKKNFIRRLVNLMKRNYEQQRPAFLSRFSDQGYANDVVKGPHLEV